MGQTTRKDRPKLGAVATELDEHLGNAQAFARRRQRAARAPPDVADGCDQFCRTATRLIRAALVHRGLRGGDLEDQVQEVWRRILPKLADFQCRGAGTVAGWIRKITRCRATQYWREAKRRKESPAEPEILDGVIDSGPDPASIAQRREDVALVREACASIRPFLSETDEAILDKCVLGGQSAKSVGGQLGMKEAAVRYSVWQVRERIRQELRRRAVGTQSEAGETAAVQDWPQ